MARYFVTVYCIEIGYEITYEIAITYEYAMPSAVITMVENGGCLSPEPLRDVFMYS